MGKRVEYRARLTNEAGDEWPSVKTFPERSDARDWGDGVVKIKPMSVKSPTDFTIQKVEVVRDEQGYAESVEVID